MRRPTPPSYSTKYEDSGHAETQEPRSRARLGTYCCVGRASAHCPGARTLPHCVFGEDPAIARAIASKSCLVPIRAGLVAAGCPERNVHVIAVCPPNEIPLFKGTI